ncbi:hypothetical protein [Actinokineospora sp. UTMC 2448]|uniref:hypothetical protein n=1 Tax=Actinokineospora sp. UTMC 2448 TaxID=2268449 RepID=UPI0021643A45|nr:hypothetical protein [Actinokineospora sp. UTMC 2448]UVS77054.1 hypothetical protein Actkin_00756 [Actinokineospora sp. UTMC 2448]
MSRVRTAIVLAAGLIAVTACGAKPSGSAVAVPSSVPSPTPAESTTTGSTTTGSTTTAPVQKVTKRSTARPTTKKPAPTTTKTRKPSGGGDSNAVIGPFGWQTLTLDMTPDEAEALGMATPTPEGDDLCQVWPALDITALERIIVHPVHGVFAVHPKAESWIHTPEGMRVGWTAAQVAAVYPDFDPAHFDYPHGPAVAVPGNADAVYRMQFSESGVLVRFLLERDSDICSV